MLCFDQPTVTLAPDDVCFYPDSDDPLTWHYLPLTPRVSLDAKGAPLIRLTKYVSDKHAFALLDFDVNLGLTEEARAKYTRKLKETLSLGGEPRLVPMQAVQGTVELMLLGRQSGKEGSSELVSGISYPASPSLYNDNRAVFSVMLTPAGSEIVEASLGLDGIPDMSAVAVVYSLTFDALRPAYAIRARARWDEIHAYMKERLQYEGMFAGSDISKIIDDMTENRVINIEVDNMLSPDMKESAIESMLAQVRSMVFDTFFKPAAAPKQEEKQPGFLEGVTGLLKKPGFFGMLGHFTWTKEDRTELVQRSLDINLRERSVARMKLYPQAHLHNISQKLGSPPVVRNLSGNSDFFKKRTVVVDVNLPFEEPDSITSVVVDLTYGKQRQSLIYRPNDKAPKTATWTSQLDGSGRMLREVTATFKVNFAPRSNMTWPTSLTSEPEVFTGDFWTAAPRVVYDVGTMTFMMAPDFRWDQYPMVTLYARYLDEANGVALQQTWTLVKPQSDSKEPSSVKWPVLVRNRKEIAVEYRLACQSADGRVVDPGLWISTSRPLTNINPESKDITVYPPVAWPEQCDLITVQLSYDDPANNIRVRPKLLQFTPGTKDEQAVRLVIVDPERQTVGYQAGYYGDDSVTAPASLTDDPVIVLPAKPTGRTFVLCRPDPALFASRGVNKVELKLSHAESGTEKTLIFTSAKDVGRFAFAYRIDHTVTGKATFSIPGAAKRTVKLVCAPPGTDTIITLAGN
jgi:hypothetical protein